MKFQISRTSIWGDTKPCDEAVYLPYVQIDERSVSNCSLLNCNDKETWFQNGTNHRVENGYIKRDFNKETWFVEINSLDELFNFYKKYGSLVIENFWNDPDIPSIEIYDDYRE